MSDPNSTQAPACEGERASDIERAAIAWGDAERARIEANAAFNAELKRQRERGIFPPKVRREEEALQAATRGQWAALKELYAVLNRARALLDTGADRG
jgi:hypothetical protein